MKVLFIDSVHDCLQDRLERAGFECSLFYPKNRQQILSKIPEYHGLVVRSRTPIDAELIRAAGNLQFIARSGSGLENIDLNACEAHSIAVYSAPEGNRVAVAEHAIGMLLALFNKLIKSDTQVRSGTWDREGNRGLEIDGKTVGIIGYGQNGSAMGQRLRGFNCRILAYDKYVSNYSPPWVEESNMETLFEECDILSLHIPLTEETRFLIDTEYLNRFTKPIYLVNTSRGPIVSTSALVSAMDSGQVLGACLDVLEHEKSSFENLGDNMPEELVKLLQNDKVILSPHVAGWTVESYEKLSSILADRILADWEKN